MSKLDKFITALKSLVVDKSNSWPRDTKGGGPHKPFLLLSILEGIEQGWIENNNILLSQKLKETFYIYWDAIIGKDKNTKVSTPFNHLGGKPFTPYWELIDNKHAKFDADIYKLLLDYAFREKVRHVLMRQYFSPEASVKLAELNKVNSDAWKYSIEIDQMVEKAFTAYQDETSKRKTRLVNDQVRGTGFSLKIKEIYNNNCAICKSRVITPYGRTLVEGAHIIPWSESYNDDPRNGISLCRNHHWLFDKYLIALREDYSVEISPYLLNSNNTIDINSIKDNRILLPENSDYYPAKEAILDHKNRFNTYYQE